MSQRATRLSWQMSQRAPYGPGEITKADKQVPLQPFQIRCGPIQPRVRGREVLGKALALGCQLKILSPQAVERASERRDLDLAALDELARGQRIAPGGLEIAPAGFDFALRPIKRPPKALQLLPRRFKGAPGRVKLGKMVRADASARLGCDALPVRGQGLESQLGIPLQFPLSALTPGHRQGRRTAALSPKPMERRTGGTHSQAFGFGKRALPIAALSCRPAIPQVQAQGGLSAAASPSRPGEVRGIFGRSLAVSPPAPFSLEV